MPGTILPYVVASMVPAILLALGVAFGVVWIWGALTYMTLLAFVFDSVSPFGNDTAPSSADAAMANGLSVALAVAHFTLFGLAIRGISGGGNLIGGERILGFFAFGLFFGQVSNSNAHELIHRPSRILHWLGAWVFISHLFGHHTSAHRLVHHRYVATQLDPNSAPLGMSFYRFLLRAWVGSFRAGLAAENARRSGGGGGVHPYLFYVVGGVFVLGLSWLIAGVFGVLAHLALATYANIQLLLSDYVQHYGLRRKRLQDGQFEPVNAAHSWDSPHRFTGWVMLNAPRHADHHAHPGRAFPSLSVSAGARILPHSLPVMGVIAWSPALWRRLMDVRLADDTHGPAAE